ncbi:chloride channel protein [Morganella morganii]
MKFIGGLDTPGSGMVPGREGPAVQSGANVSGLVSALTWVKNKESRHTLLATGAAAGLTAVFIGVIMSGIVFQTVNSGAPIWIQANTMPPR